MWTRDTTVAYRFFSPDGIDLLCSPLRDDATTGGATCCPLIDGNCMVSTHAFCMLLRTWHTTGTLARLSFSLLLNQNQNPVLSRLSGHKGLTAFTYYTLSIF